MFFGGLGLMVGVIALASFVLLIMALVDLVRRPADVWATSGQNQLVWALVVIFVGLVGPLLYLIIARPMLDDASSRSMANG